MNSRGWGCIQVNTVCYLLISLTLNIKCENANGYAQRERACLALTRPSLSVLSEQAEQSGCLLFFSCFTWLLLCQLLISLEL